MGRRNCAASPVDSAACHADQQTEALFAFVLGGEGKPVADAGQNARAAGVRATCAGLRRPGRQLLPGRQRRWRLRWRVQSRAVDELREGDLSGIDATRQSAPWRRNRRCRQAVQGFDFGNQLALFDNVIGQRVCFAGRQGDGASSGGEKLAEAGLAIGEAFAECAEADAECSAGEGQGLAIAFSESRRGKALGLADERAGERASGGLGIDLVGGCSAALALGVCGRCV